MNNLAQRLHYMTCALGMGVGMSLPPGPMRESDTFKRKCMGTRSDREKLAAAKAKQDRRKARNLAIVERNKSKPAVCKVDDPNGHCHSLLLNGSHCGFTWDSNKDDAVVFIKKTNRGVLRGSIFCGDSMHKLYTEMMSKIIDNLENHLANDRPNFTIFMARWEQGIRSIMDINTFLGQSEDAIGESVYADLLKKTHTINDILSFVEHIDTTKLYYHMLENHILLPAHEALLHGQVVEDQRYFNAEESMCNCCITIKQLAGQVAKLIADLKESVRVRELRLASKGVSFMTAPAFNRDFTSKCHDPVGI